MHVNMEDHKGLPERLDKFIYNILLALVDRNKARECLAFVSSFVMPGCPCSFMPTFLSVLSMLSMLSMPCGSLDRSMCIVSGEFIGRVLFLPLFWFWPPLQWRTAL